LHCHRIKIVILSPSDNHFSKLLPSLLQIPTLRHALRVSSISIKTSVTDEDIITKSTSSLTLTSAGTAFAKTSGIVKIVCSLLLPNTKNYVGITLILAWVVPYSECNHFGAYERSLKFQITGYHSTPWVRSLMCAHCRQHMRSPNRCRSQRSSHTDSRREAGNAIPCARKLLVAQCSDSISRLRHIPAR